MRIMAHLLNSAEYLRPSSVGEAIEILKNHPKSDGKDATFIAGGTDLIPLIKLGLKTPACLVSLSRITELSGIRIDGEFISIGALTTLADIAEHWEIIGSVPALSKAALSVGSPQLRNRGTVGGNLFQDRRCLYFNQSEFWRSSIRTCFKTGGEVCHQIPNASVCRAFYYSDLATALLALDSSVTLHAAGEQKTLPLEDVLEEHLTSNGRLEYSRVLLTEARFRLPRFSYFAKFAWRQSFDFPLLNFSAVKTDSGWRAFAGGWGTKPARLSGTEEALSAGKSPENLEQTFLKKEVPQIR